MFRGRGHSRALCHWQKLPHWEAETIQVASGCFPNWDSHPPGSAAPSITCRARWLTFPSPAQSRALAPSPEEAASSFLLRQPVQGSVDWQRKRSLEWGKNLQKSLLPQHCSQTDLLKTKVRTYHNLLTVLHPLGIKPRVLTKARQACRIWYRQPLPLSFCTQASGISCCFWFLVYLSLPEGLCSCCSSARNALPFLLALLVLLVDLAHRSLPPRGSLWPLVWSSCASSKSLSSL